MIPDNYDNMIANLKVIRDSANDAMCLCMLEEKPDVDRIYSAMCGVLDAWIQYDNEIHDRMFEQLKGWYGDDNRTT